MKAYQINIPAYVVLFQGVAYVVRDECPGLTFGFQQEDISLLQNNIDQEAYYTPLALDEVFLIACLENIKAGHPHKGTRDLAAAMLEACAAGDTSARVAGKAKRVYKARVKKSK